MRGRSKTLDLRVSWMKDGTYRLPGSCANCDWEGTLLLSRGSAAPSHFQLLRESLGGVVSENHIPNGDVDRKLRVTHE